MIRRSLAALGVLLSAGMATPTPPPSPTSLPTAATATVPAADAQDQTKVTLLTGDVVTYDTSPDGSPQVQIEPARRPDGPPVFFMSARDGDAYYVYPTDVMDELAAGRLDRGLFDVAYLAGNGYTDAESPTLPLIVQHGAVKGIAAATSIQALPSIDGAAVKVDKKRAGSFWSGVDQARTAAPTKIWLDRKVKVALDTSVKQIGAPEAWAMGLRGEGVKVAVLDTGVDAAHPDLAGRIAATANFTGDASAQDGHGHGTHVASIIASGNATYPGVAPQASLLVGKVLNRAGSGTESGVIAGMQWAADQKAQVINMSLGACCPGPDNPINQALDTLTAQSGALFVVAAGNSGDSRTIGAPGTSASALTVGAVDDADKLASFSSRGPTAVAYGLKPDLAAPGVNIVAARAQGTSMGVPVDATHTTASGTSMATPHVAGAAALLAGQHPDWTNVQIKQALVSTAREAAQPAYEQGSGRVDVARAVKQQVRASGNIDFGFLASPQSGKATRTLTYTNDGDQPVTLTLRSGITAHRGAAPEGTLTLENATVTVPAGGSAPVAVTFDPSGPATWYEGFVHASDASGAVQVSTAVGAFVEPKKITVRTRVILPDGASMPTEIPWLLMRTDDRDDLETWNYAATGQQSEAVVYPGTYSVITAVAWRGTDGEWVQSLPSDPQLEITEDTTVTFDLRKARKVSASTSRDTEVYNSFLAYRRKSANGAEIDVVTLYPTYGLHNYVMLPTRKVTQGSLTFGAHFQMGAPAVRMKVDGGPEITPRYQDLSGQTPRLDGNSTLPLVDAGHGTDFTGLDVRGKLVLLNLDDLCPETMCSDSGLDRIQAAQAAGAVGVLGYGGLHRIFLDLAGYWPSYPIPTMSLTAEQGRALAALAAGKQLTVEVNATASTPYIYSLAFPVTGRIPADLDFAAGTRDLQRIENRFHADRPGAMTMTTTSTILTHPGWFHPPYPMVHSWRARTAVTEYVGPVTSEVLRERSAVLVYDGDGPYYQRRAMSANAADVFASAGSRTDAWGAQPRVPGAAEYSTGTLAAGGATCFACRTGDLFVSAVPIMGSGANHQEAFTWNANAQPLKGGKDEMHLYRDGQEIPLEQKIAAIGPFGIALPTFTLPEAESTYRLTDTFHTLNEQQVYARDIETAWTFRSKRPTGGMTSAADGLCVAWFLVGQFTPCEPARRLNVRYAVPLGLDNKVAAGGTHRITITGYNGSIDQPDAKVADLKVWATVDDGAHWNPAKVSPGGKVSIEVPVLGETTGAVGLRVHARDAEGNTVEQTVHRAYGLK